MGARCRRAAYLGAGLGVEGHEGVLDGACVLLRGRALPRRGPEEEGHLAGRRWPAEMDRGRGGGTLSVCQSPRSLTMTWDLCSRPYALVA